MSEETPVLLEESEEPVIITLFRMMRDEHVEDFLSGRLRMGSVKSYRENYEGESGAKHDRDEFLDYIANPDLVRIEIDGIEVGRALSPVKIRRAIDDRSYLLSMSAITDRFLNAGSGCRMLPEELIGLGEKAVFISDVQEFRARLADAFKKSAHLEAYPGANIQMEGLVEYVDFEGRHGDVGPFRKSDEYAFQLEWRFVVFDNRAEIERFPDHLWLDVGNLRDIVTVMDSEQFRTNAVRTCKATPPARSWES